jgi:microcystin-dependent protein
LRINQALQTTGGNARGANAVDLQTTRAGASPGQVASGANSVIVGGQNNTASGQGAVIAGGSANTASGLWSFIGSGDNNVAGGNYSAIPAGQNNVANGAYSFSSGRRAKANHSGSVVFSDSQDADMASTADNQFLVRASGGMAINTAPVSGSALTVSGRVKADSAEFGSMNVTTLTSSSVSGFGTTPLGGIIMWSGSVDSVPAGWALCNGQTVNTRTTPDLRGRFIVGAGTGAVGLTSRDPNVRGGNETTTLTVAQLPAHNHNVTGTTTSSGDHTHQLPWNRDDDGNGKGALNQDYTGLWGDSNNTQWGRQSNLAGDHAHTFNVTSGNAGSGESFSNLPPFYALAFIMRVQ